MKKILSTILLLTIMYPLGVFSASYRDTAKINSYVKVIEQRAAKNIASRSILERVDLLVKIQKLIDSYESKKSRETSKIDFVNFLYALEEYIASTLPSEESTSQNLVITIIDDVRCNSCNTQGIVSQLK